MVRLLPPQSDIGVLRAPIRSSLTLFAAFLGIFLGVSLLERMGFDGGRAPLVLVGTAFAVFVLAALYAHSRRAIDFYIADRQVPGSFGGLAGGAALAGILAIGLAGGDFASTTEFLVSAAGLVAGYLVLAIAISPRLRAFGAYTAGDFVAARFRSGTARLVWAGGAFIAAFLIYVAHLKIAMPLIATPLGVTPEHALYAAAALSAMAALPGGMRSLTWTQALQYLLILLACLLPAAYLASGRSADGAVTQEIVTLLAGSLPSFRDGGAAGFAFPFLLAALGAAALPHLLARTLSAASVRDAATSMIWGAMLAIVAILAGLVLMQLLIAAAGEDAPIGADLLQSAAIFTALPAALAGLVLAGTLAALFALGQAALFAAATTLSHDVWDESVDRKGPEGRRIIVARLIVLAVAALGALTALRWDADAAALMQWALAFSAAGAFMPLLLGLWWRRCNEIGAIGGMIAGFGFAALVFLLAQHLIPDAMVTSGWSGVDAATAAIAGALMSLVATVGLSLVTPAPEADRDEVAQDVRRGALPIRERPA